MLGLSASEVHAGIRRAERANLMVADRKVPHQPLLILVVREALIEFVTHGVRYVYIVERGPLTRGFPTAHGAPPLDRHFRNRAELPVWPHAEGTARGEAFSPLYKGAPRAAQASSRMYQALALIDAIRGGRARERELAKKLFVQLVSENAAS